MTNASRKQYQKYVLNVADDQEGIANIKEPSKFSLEDLRLKQEKAELIVAQKRENFLHYCNQLGNP